MMEIQVDPYFITVLLTKIKRGGMFTFQVKSRYHTDAASILSTHHLQITHITPIKELCLKCTQFTKVVRELVR